MRSFRGSKEETTFNDQGKRILQGRLRTGQRCGGEGPGECDASEAKKEKCFRKGVISDIKIC